MEVTRYPIGMSHKDIPPKAYAHKACNKTLIYYQPDCLLEAQKAADENGYYVSADEIKRTSKTDKDGKMFFVLNNSPSRSYNEMARGFAKAMDNPNA